MAISYSTEAYDISNLPASSGWYNIKLSTGNVTTYIDNSYDGGGWILVMQNRRYTGGMNNLTYSDAINQCNYRTEPSSNNSTNTKVGGPKAGDSLANYNVFIGLKHWSALAGRVTSGYITVVQYAAASNGVSLTGTHSERWRWRFTGFNSTYAMQGAGSIGGEGGTTTPPGMYSYHAANAFNLTTYDNDQDTNGGNCATYYNNNPFWYGSCWSGNWFAGGGGYVDAPYWTSSDSANQRQFGAVYIK